MQGEVFVDNDVNWAASAELSARADATDFGYLHLGTGLGGAVINDGSVRRGHRGLVGEIAHLVVAGPEGRAMPVTQVFGEMGLRQPDSTAIDIVRVREALAERRSAALIGRALAGVVSVRGAGGPGVHRGRRRVGRARPAMPGNVTARRCATGFGRQRCGETTLTGRRSRWRSVHPATVGVDPSGRCRLTCRVSDAVTVAMGRASPVR